MHFDHQELNDARHHRARANLPELLAGGRTRRRRPMAQEGAGAVERPSGGLTVTPVRWQSATDPCLSPAEHRLLPYLSTYRTLTAIAMELFLSRNTVKSQVWSIYTKLGATSRSGAMEKAISLGLVQDPLRTNDASPRCQ
jgi:DNA-binding NarL/FixJ family response regulator